MVDEAKGNGSSCAAAAGGFRAKMEHFMYSGDKKHVMAGLAIVTIIFGVPWYLMNRGTKHQSHQDYLEKARSERLSSSSSSAK
ncbi:hypothetical protein Droror1_Dr00013351 [Drosera rotundifolia]